MKILVDDAVRKVPLSERWTHRRRRRPVSLVAPTPAEQARIDREPQIDYALVFRERIKQLGDDGLKEEPRLRAFEHTVRIVSRDRNCSIDKAKQLVLDAIAKAKELV